MTLVVISTHPIQYHAPVYRATQAQFGVPVTAIYGSDFSVAGYTDREFGVRFAWDTDLLSGYEAHFLARMSTGGAASPEAVAARGLRAALRAARPTAVLLIGYATRFYRAALGQIVRGGYPLIFRAETSDHARPRSKLKALARDALLRTLYRRCAALLYVGSLSRAHYLRLGAPEQRMIFSPYCVDPAPFRADEQSRGQLRPAARAELGLHDGQLALLFSGKLVPRKGPQLLLQAARLLPPELREQLVLLVAGDGELRAELERQAACAPPLRLNVLGFQSQHALSRCYHAADLLALPSQLDETWGLVVNEALHHGLPCVVSDQVGCAPDLIAPGATGELFTAGSVASLAAALERAVPLVGQPAVRERCRRQVDDFSVERAAAGLAAAYRLALATPAPRVGAT